MKISEPTILALALVITGDGDFTPYRSGQQLVAFFNQFGSDDTYDGGFPSRGVFTEEKLHEFNDTPAMKDIIICALDPRHFLMTEFHVEDAIEHVNKFLEYDDLQVLLDGKKLKLCKIDESDIEINLPYKEGTQITEVFISEQIEKCDKKLSIKDYDGAITNARSLMEAVLTNIEHEFDKDTLKYDGNLPKLYRRVQKLLNLQPGQEGLDDCLRQILSGLTSVVSGLSTLRNTMSDSHVISYKPSEHHARLAVNASKTICNFLFKTKEYQMKGKKRSS